MVAGEIVAPFLALGLGGAFAIALAEKMIPVVPSYVILMLLGMSVPSGSSVIPVLFATVTGSLFGTMIWYGLGRLLGERRVERAVARFGPFVFFRLPAYLRLARSYRRNRFWVTAIGQIVPVARIYLALPAGVLRLGLASFIPAALLGIVAWNTPFLVLGLTLRGTGHDIGQVGLMASVALIGGELTIMALFALMRRTVVSR